jgi:uncharacterized protein YjaZ
VLLRTVVALLLSAATLSCGRTHNITVEFYSEGGYRFSQAERDTIEDIADATIPEVRRFLPTLPADLILKVYPGKDVIPETGEGGSIASPNKAFWIVSPDRPEGIIAIAERELRGTLFHELHHLVRSQTPDSDTLMDRVVTEGLATLFERDEAGMPAPWGQYPQHAADWVKELIAQPSGASWKPWMSRHPDGRRWIGYKAGTYIAEQASRASGKSSAELANVPTAEVLRLAGFD